MLRASSPAIAATGVNSRSATTSTGAVRGQVGTFLCSAGKQRVRRQAGAAV